MMLNFELHEGRVEIEEAEHSHFVMNKGEKISYRIHPNMYAEEHEVVKIFTSDSGSVKLSREQCSRKEGCDFEVSAV